MRSSSTRASRCSVRSRSLCITSPYRWGESALERAAEREAAAELAGQQQVEQDDGHRVEEGERRQLPVLRLVVGAEEGEHADGGGEFLRRQQQDEGDEEVPPHADER